MRRRPALLLFVLTAWTSQAILACAQTAPTVAPPITVTSTEEAAPISPATSPGPMSLDACIDLGFQYQPALNAARASLSATEAGKRGVDRLIIPRIFTKDLPIRRQQACQGVSIAGAALSQAEAETRYAITRNFFTVQYIRSQQIVIADVLRSLENGLDRAKKILAIGDVEAKITVVDIENLQIQVANVRSKKSLADNGMLKALAALREAMGVAYDYPLEIAVAELPQAVYPVKVAFEEKEYDAKGNSKLVKKSRIEYRSLYKIDEKALIAAALASRGEIIQANAAARVVDLEIQAQEKIRGWQARTFAQGADIHVQPIPQGRSNGEYVPGAISFEMPVSFAGRKVDRVERARALAQRAGAVVDKAENLVSLDVVAQYLKWQEAAEDVAQLKGVYDIAQALPARVMKLMQNKDLTGIAIIQSNLQAITVRTQLNDEMHIHALALAGLERATAGAFRIYPVPAPPAEMSK